MITWYGLTTSHQIAVGETRQDIFDIAKANGTEVVMSWEHPGIEQVLFDRGDGDKILRKQQ